MSKVSEIESQDCLRAAKTQLRLRMKLQLKQIAPEERDQKSAKIVSALRTILVARVGAGSDAAVGERNLPAIVGSFIGLPSEPNLRALDSNSFELDKVGPDQDPQIRFAYPVIDDTSFYFVSPKSDGNFPCKVNATLQVEEPDVAAFASAFEKVDGHRLNCVLVPGLAFDMRGGRLGRGKGFYDRALVNLKCDRIGICFDEQFLVDESTPQETHDVRMQAVVTDAGVRL